MPVILNEGKLNEKFLFFIKLDTIIRFVNRALINSGSAKKKFGVTNYCIIVND